MLCDALVPLRGRAVAAHVHAHRLLKDASHALKVGASEGVGAPFTKGSFFVWSSGSIQALFFRVNFCALR